MGAPADRAPKSRRRHSGPPQRPGPIHIVWEFIGEPGTPRAPPLLDSALERGCSGPGLSHHEPGALRDRELRLGGAVTRAVSLEPPDRVLGPAEVVLTAATRGLRVVKKVDRSLSSGAGHADISARTPGEPEERTVRGHQTS